MTRALSTEEPCAANVACTVLKASAGGDPISANLIDIWRELRPPKSGSLREASAYVIPPADNVLQRKCGLHGMLDWVKRKSEFTPVAWDSRSSPRAIPKGKYELHTEVVFLSASR